MGLRDIEGYVVSEQAPVKTSKVGVYYTCESLHLHLDDSDLIHSSFGETRRLTVPRPAFKPSRDERDPNLKVTESRTY